MPGRPFEQPSNERTVKLFSRERDRLCTVGKKDGNTPARGATSYLAGFIPGHLITLAPALDVAPGCIKPRQ